MCCQGWLEGEAYGHRFFPGQPCRMLGKTGCSIYEQRPYSPCKTFECEWKIRNNIDDDLRPDRIGVIMVGRITEGHRYIRVIETDKPISEKVYKWADAYNKKWNTNIIVPVLGGIRVYSSNTGFKDSISKIYKVVEYFG